MHAPSEFLHIRYQRCIHLKVQESFHAILLQHIYSGPIPNVLDDVIYSQ